jgi:D-glycero-D-manno-heptose 1,7-bisphosphate phosphatase
MIDGAWTVFVDRDGVINRRIVGDYVRSIDDFEFLSGSLEALALLAGRVRHVVVVTNQQGIGKGLFGEADLRAIHGHMVAEVERAGGRIDAVIHCPHLVDSGCDCRKPAPGMGHQAVAMFPDIDLERAVMIGDSASDLGFARALGIQSVLVSGLGQDGSPSVEGVRVASSLLDASRMLTE